VDCHPGMTLEACGLILFPVSAFAEFALAFLKDDILLLIDGSLKQEGAGSRSARGFLE